jgi:flagellar motor switch protein FliG
MNVILTEIGMKSMPIFEVLATTHQLSYYINMEKPKLPNNMFHSQRLSAYQKTLGKKDEEGDAKVFTEKLPPSIDEGLLKTTTDFSAESEFKKTESENRDNIDFTKKKVFTKVIPREEIDENSGEDSKYRRVAKFLILIGREEAGRNIASEILAKLEIEQVEQISKEISSIRGISKEESVEIFDEFRSLLAAGYQFLGAASGGIDATRNILYAAFGPEKGESFLRKTVPESVENPFDFLEEFSGEQVSFILKDESSAVTALVLSRLSPKLSASCLALMNPVRKLDIVKRIAHLSETLPEVLERVAQGLKDKAHTVGKVDSVNIDGRSALTAILKHMDISSGETILNELEENDPELSEDIKDRLHTLEDVIKAEDKPLQNHLRSLSDKDIALLLKGKSEAFAEKILSNLSSHRRSIIKEEIEIMGPVSKRDVDTADKAFLTWFRNGREEGRIVLIDDEDVII